MILKFGLSAMMFSLVCSTSWSNDDIDRVGKICSTKDFLRKNGEDVCSNYAVDGDPLINCSSQKSNDPTKDKCGVACEEFLLVPGKGKNRLNLKEAFGGDEDKSSRNLNDDELKSLKTTCLNETQCSWDPSRGVCFTKTTGKANEIWPNMRSPRNSPKKK
ncbi:MAG: hypothetical protein V4544_03760 [Pseudomonadota bacterium]